VAERASRIETVPVPGGALTVEIAAGATDPVLAIHGISSHRRLWDWLRADAPELSLIAPDLRGRGDSVTVTGRSGLTRHADDMVAVLDALGLDAVHVVGMSMGGFVGVDLALRHAGRVRSLVLVDGGFPMHTPPGLTRDDMPKLLADRIGRLDRTWESLDDYVAYFLGSTTPLLDPGDPLLRGYLAHDLGSDGRVRLSADALITDATDVFFSPAPWHEVTVPMRLLYAEWSTGADALPAAYPHERVKEFSRTARNLVDVRFLAGADHAATIMTKAGAAATAELIHQAIA
jgi:pimeloyl-ACP methyl ester carboxylesterase